MNRTRFTIAAALALALAGANARAQEEGTDKKWEGRVFVSVNGGYQTLNPAFSYVDTQVLFLEQASAEASFPEAGGPGFDLGGGVRLAGNFGVGATYTRFDRTDPASLTLEMPHPLFWEEPGTASLSVPLIREESVVHVQAIYMIPVLRQLQVGVFGGPSFFMCRQQMISNFFMDLSLNPDLTMNLDLSSPETVTVDDNLWGYNVGTDVNFLFTRHIGMGALVRYSSASHEEENALQAARTQSTGDPIVMDHGGLQFGVGLRLRF